MININELKAAIVRKGLTQTDVAQRLNVTPRTFGSKLGKGVFNSDEIENMIRILEIKDPMPIFFDGIVS